MPTKSALYEGFNTGFIDRNNNSNLAYRPEFVSNDPAEGKRVLSTIEKELSICDEFLISVAFITLGGITPLLQIFKELEQKGIPGKILTTDYLSFTDPAALDKLNALTNIELRIFDTANNDENSGNIGFHTKGYLFRKDEVYRMIIGSSNITASALKINREWNTKIVGYETGEVIGDVLNEFQSLWSDRRTKRYEDFIEEYRVRYKLIAEQKKIARTQTPVKFEQYRLQPNSMQVEFVNKVKKLVSDGQTKALLISATGTGKTYASAFAIREMHPKRVLFLVHREQIAKQAMKSYQNVFGERKVDGSKYTYELLTGNTSSKLEQIKKADLIFATMQTVSKDNVLSALDPKEFSCICLDEAHHTGAGSYQKIMAYFQPDFWLGMTASPDTNRFDVYKIFDHNIACEIRLQQALENNLLCPFHYFGITDIEIDGHEIGDSSEGDEDKSTYFNRLVSDDRVTHVIEQAQYYGHSGERVKGLIFCSRKEEAKTLSRKFNERGLKTAVLTGEDSEAVREETINRLVGEGEDILDYIFTVDIFSEGVDMTSMVVGLIFLFSRLFDGVTDLIAGFIIDHTHTRWGKSRPYDLVQIPLWGFVVLCFSIPGSLSAVGKVIWVVVAYNMSQSVCYTLTACANNIRLKHYASEEKLPKVMSVGTIILTILGMGLNIIMPILIKIFENRPHGWTTLALLVSVPCMLGGVLRFFMLDEYAENPEAAKEAEKTEASKEKVSFKDIVKAFASNKSIWVVALFVFLPGLNNSFSVVGNYFFKYIFGDIAIAAIPMLVGAVLGLIFMAFYPAITKKIGNRNVAYLGFGMFLVGNAGKLVSLHNIIGLSILTACPCI